MLLRAVIYPCGNNKVLDKNIVLLLMLYFAVFLSATLMGSLSQDLVHIAEGERGLDQVNFLLISLSEKYNFSDKMF